jgi:superfamily II DNA helicase RecQ
MHICTQLTRNCNQAQVYDASKRRLGYCHNYIVTPEQFVHDDGKHLPWFGQHVKEISVFRKAIKHVFVDEAHFMYTAGEKISGMPAFRPAWGQLNKLKLALPTTTTWHATTATLPPYMAQVVKNKVLNQGHSLVRTSSNRPNLVYAMHTVVDSFDNMKNFDCLLVKPYDPAKQPRTLLFFDSIKLEQKMHDYLVASIPEQYSGSVSLYHSDMSSVHLEDAYTDFTCPNSNLRILLTMSGQSTVFYCLCSYPRTSTLNFS